MDEKVDLKWEDDGGKRGISDTVKKLIASGLSSAFMTEDTLRTYLNDLKLPTDVLAQILKGAKKSRDELIGRASTELSKLIQKIDLVAEVRKLLLENSIQVKAKIDFVPKSENDKES